MRVAAAVAVALGAVGALGALGGVAHAQIIAVLGHPLPDPSLAAHTLVVRVLAGSMAKPVAGIDVLLVGDGAPRSAKTDAVGRATFTIAPHAHVRASVATSDRKAIHSSDLIDLPDDLGERGLLSTVAVSDEPPPPPPADPDPSDDRPFAIDATCHSNDARIPSDPPEVLVGKPLPKPLVAKLGALRGKALLLNIGGTFNCAMEAHERASLSVAAKNIAVVQLMSASDAEDLAACVGAKPGYLVILDVPVKQDAVIGALTASLGIHQLPETLLVDAKGIVRFHYISTHDWSTDDAQRCAATFAR